MRCILFVSLVVFCVASVSFGDTTIDVMQSRDAAAGLASYTIQVTGTGINCLGGFEITGQVHQVWTGDDTQSEWLHNSNGNTPGNRRDSYVIFGEERFPDLPNMGGSGVPSNTVETIDSGGTVGLGTLNNPFDTHDAYIIFSAPSQTPVTHDMMKLVIPHGEHVVVELNVYTYDDSSGEAEFHLLAAFVGDKALRFTSTSVPEPSSVLLIAMGIGFALLRRNR